MDVTFRCIVFSYRDIVYRSYRRRFPVVYLTYPAMRRPQVVNKQLEVCAFFVYIYVPLKTCQSEKRLKYN